MILPRAVRPFVLALALVPFAACATQSVLQQSQRYEQVGDYRRAFRVLEDEREAQLRAGEPVPEALEAAYQRSLLIYLRSRARMAIFGEREDEALADLDRIAAIDPNYPEINTLRQRAMQKQAQRIAAEAEEQFGQQNFAAAMELYLEAQRLVPDLLESREGIANVAKEMARKTDRAQREFLEAVRKVPEFRHVEVEWHATNVIHNAPGRADARELSEQARRERARNVFEQAQQCQRSDQFGAALVLFRTASGLDPDLAGVQDAIVEMEREVAAQKLVDDAQLDIRALRFEEAKRQLAEAFEMSTLSRGAISELLIEARRGEAEQLYQRGRDLEVQGKKQEALLLFDAVAKEWPDGLRDEEARRTALRVDIEGAQREWNAAIAAEAAGDLEQAIEHYLNAERFYEKWRDGELQAQRLRAVVDTRRAQAERSEAPAGDAATGSEPGTEVPQSGGAEPNAGGGEPGSGG